jgi:hypothetical protein
MDFIVIYVENYNSGKALYISSTGKGELDWISEIISENFPKVKIDDMPDKNNMKIPQIEGLSKRFTKLEGKESSIAWWIATKFCREGGWEPFGEVHHQSFCGLERITLRMK